MIPGRLALLVARLVFLIHDDRAEVAAGRKDRRARADSDTLLPALQGAPGIESLTIRKTRVQHRHEIAEHRTEAVHRLRRERDLRHEHDRALPLPEHESFEHLKIDQGLPTPRDAMEKERGPRSAGEDRVACGHLRGCRRHGRWRADGTRRERITVATLLLHARVAAFHEPAHHRGRAAKLLHEMRHGRATAELLEELEELALLRCALERLIAREQRGQCVAQHENALGLHRRHRPGRHAQRGRQRRAHHETDRRHIVLGHPGAEREQIGTHRRREVRHVDDGLRLRVAECCAIALAHADADHAAIAHRDDHATPGDERVLRDGRHGVGECAGERQRECDLHQALAPRVSSRGGVRHPAGRDARDGASGLPCLCSQSYRSAARSCPRW